MKKTDEQIVSLVNDEFTNSIGGEHSTIASERAKAWKYYNGEPLGNEPEDTNQSRVVMSDVSDMVDSIMPSLLRLFTSAENLVSFDPVSADDIAKAEQESDYVNYLFFKKNPAFLFLYTWFMDALIQKNGIAKAWFDEAERVTQETYKNLPENEYFALLEDEELDIIEQETVVVDEQLLYNVKFKRVAMVGTPRVENVPPEEYRISNDSRSLDPSQARMVGHEKPMTRSELIEMGFDADIVADLPAYFTDSNSPEKIARRNRAEEQNTRAREKSQQQVLYREAYVRLDLDDDGISELRQIIIAGGKLLSNEVVDRQPFHVISPKPLPHKHFGRSIADQLFDVQDVSTTLVRQQLDNIYQTNNPAWGVWEQAIGEDSYEDLQTSRIGSIKRFKRPVSEAVQPLAVPFTAGESFPILQYFDEIKRRRIGVNADSEGLDPNALKNVQTTLFAQASDVSRMKIEAIVRIFAETGIRSLFLHFHEMARKYQNRKEIVQLRGEFIEVDPQEWNERNDLTINIGLGMGTREQNLMHLNTIAEKQSQIVASGGYGTLVTPKNIYNTCAEIVKNANMKQPSMFFTDPGDAMPEEQPDPLVEAQVQAQARDFEIREAALRQDAIEAEQRNQRERIRIEQEVIKQRQAHQIEIEKLKNELTKLELTTGQNVPGAGV